MPRFRNPRYAPEALERRLFPSVSLSSVVTSACVSVLADPKPDTPPPDDGEYPPIVFPPTPTGPIVPA